jgi:hypothetical protein
LRRKAAKEGVKYEDQATSGKGLPVSNNLFLCLMIMNAGCI